MTLGTRLTILDYLGAEKSTDVWEHRQRQMKRLSLPYEKKFAGALSACLTERKTSGLNAADYLSMPVRVRYDTDVHVLKPRQEGKNVEIKEAPGFAVNRILCPMINEAIFVLAEGIATAEDIDNGMTMGANHPIGPLALADMIGLDTMLFVLDGFQKELGEDKYRPAPLLRKMVRAGYLGQFR